MLLDASTLSAPLPSSKNRTGADFATGSEEAVKWRVLEQTMAEARGKFSDLAPEALDSLLDEAVAATRQAGAGKAG
jgi:hypothetical protein